jgi:hypothetical protein
LCDLEVKVVHLFMLTSDVQFLLDYVDFVLTLLNVFVDGFVLCLHL